MRLPLILLGALLLGSFYIGPITASKNQKKKHSKTSIRGKVGAKNIHKKGPPSGGNPAMKVPTRGPTLGGSSPSLQPYPSWMAKLDGGLSITELSIPGRCIDVPILMVLIQGSYITDISVRGPRRMHAIIYLHYSSSSIYAELL